MRKYGVFVNDIGSVIYIGKRWTKTAIECLERGCVCEGCFFNSFFTLPDKCKMKIVVIELVKELGLPDQQDNKCPKCGSNKPSLKHAYCKACMKEYNISYRKKHGSR